MEKTFDDVVDFHRHLCLDIAMGFRIGKTLVREMGKELRTMKDVFAIVENETCAVDAIQEFTGCTMGKRNLILAGTGKPVYILQNTKSGVAVRVYCKYWETFDLDGAFGKRRKQASSPEATTEDQQVFQRELNTKIKEILRAPEETLFVVQRVTLPAPPKVGKYKAEACAGCGEHTHVERLAVIEGRKLCRACQGTPVASSPS
jgi:formylmethanofuran dehydrogenase subunit E